MRTKNLAMRGFTIIELLVVMVIIGAVLGGVYYFVFSTSTKVQINQAETLVKQVQGLLKTHAMRGKGYPTTDEGLDVLNRPGTPPDELLNFLDPWGNKLNYINPGIRNPSSYDLFSNGPDGKPNTEDDIGNW